MTFFASINCDSSLHAPGDLYVYLDVKEIPEIQRDGISLTSTISIRYFDAILGTVAKVIISLIIFALRGYLKVMLFSAHLSLELLPWQNRDQVKRKDPDSR